MRRVWLRRAVTSYGECSCLHRFSCATARADRRAWFCSCVARCLWTLHRTTIGLKSSTKRINCNDNTRAERFRALLGLPWMQTSPFGQESSAESAAGAAPPLVSQLVSSQITAGTRARPRRAQALDVHCVLDPSNSSNPSDGAPLDQLCPSMRGCLRLRAADSAATKDNDTTSNDRSGRRPGH